MEKPGDEVGTIDRVNFVRTKFIPRISAVRHSVELDYLYFLPKDKFLSYHSLQPFEYWLEGKNHISGLDIKGDSTILFICHQWYEHFENALDDKEATNKEKRKSQKKKEKEMNAEGNEKEQSLVMIPDTKEGASFKICKHFLEQNQDIEYIWVDYSCLNHETDKQHNIESIQTVMLLSTHCLVVPRLTSQKEELNEDKTEDVAAKVPWLTSQREEENEDQTEDVGAKEFTFTDLKKFSARGWFKVEVIVAIMSFTKVYVACVLDGVYSSFPMIRIKTKGKVQDESSLLHKLKDTMKAAEITQVIRYATEVAKGDFHKNGVYLPKVVQNNWQEATESINIISLAWECYHRHELESQFWLCPDDHYFTLLRKALSKVSDPEDRDQLCSLLLSCVSFIASPENYLEDKPLEEVLKLARLGYKSAIKTYDYRSRGLNPENIAQLLSHLEKKEHEWHADFSENVVGIRGCSMLKETIEAPKNCLEKLLLDKTFLLGQSLRLLADGLQSQHCTLTLLSLQKNKIDAKGARILSPALLENRSLEDLRIGDNSLGEEGLSELAPAIWAHERLKKLGIQNNDIDSSGAYILGCIIEESQSLEAINASNNTIKDGVEKLLPDKLEEKVTLKSLNLAANSIDRRGASHLATFLKRNKVLTTLILDRNYIESRGALYLGAALKVNSSLTTLSIKKNGIGDEGAKGIGEALHENTSLTALGLDNNGIGPEGMNSICSALNYDNESVTELSLTFNALDYEGSSILGDCLMTNEHLLNLMVGSCQMTLGGSQALMDGLEQNCNLVELHLHGNKLKPDAVLSIAHYLENNKVLKVLNLWACGIQDAEATAMAKCLEENPSLKVLLLFANNIGKNGAAAFSEMLKKNKALVELDLSEHDFNLKEFKAFDHAMSKNKTMQFLRISDSTKRQGADRYKEMGQNQGAEESKARVEEQEMERVLGSIIAKLEANSRFKMDQEEREGYVSGYHGHVQALSKRFSFGSSILDEYELKAPTEIRDEEVELEISQTLTKNRLGASCHCLVQ